MRCCLSFITRGRISIITGGNGEDRRILNHLILTSSDMPTYRNSIPHVNGNRGGILLTHSSAYAHIYNSDRRPGITVILVFLFLDSHVHTRLTPICRWQSNNNINTNLIKSLATFPRSMDRRDIDGLIQSDHFDETAESIVITRFDWLNSTLQHRWHRMRSAPGFVLEWKAPVCTHLQMRCCDWRHFLRRANWTYWERLVSRARKYLRQTT